MRFLQWEWRGGRRCLRKKSIVQLEKKMFFKLHNGFFLTMTKALFQVNKSSISGEQTMCKETVARPPVTARSSKGCTQHSLFLLKHVCICNTSLGLAGFFKNKQTVPLLTEVGDKRNSWYVNPHFPSVCMSSSLGRQNKMKRRASTGQVVVWSNPECNVFARKLLNSQL